MVTPTGINRNVYTEFGRINVLFYLRVDNLSRAVYAFLCELVDEILLPRYVNWSTNFRSLPLKVQMAPSCLKYMNSVLFVFTNASCCLRLACVLLLVLLLAPGLAAGFQLGQVYLQVYLGDHLRSLNMSQFLPYIICFFSFLV